MGIFTKISKGVGPITRSMNSITEPLAISIGKNVLPEKIAPTGNSFNDVSSIQMGTNIPTINNINNPKMGSSTMQTIMPQTESYVNPASSLFSTTSRGVVNTMNSSSGISSISSQYRPFSSSSIGTATGGQTSTPIGAVAPDNTMYYILGGLGITGIAAYVFMNSKGGKRR
jgi:hypothetical protein